MTLSVIIPILNEADELPDLLAHLLPLGHHGTEIIFADGGSSDGSAEIAAHAGFKLVSVRRGRARQMNAAATQATGDVLLFLHADTRLPLVAATAIKHALAKGRNVWGRFDVNIVGHPFMLRVISRLMNVRSRLTGIATGDQAIFVTRGAFDAIGGFPDQALMEDVEISRRLLKITRPACITHRVQTSGRRWEARGVWRTIVLMWRLRWGYWRGVPVEQLEKAYR